MLPNDVAVITDGVPGMILQANMTGCGRVMGPQVLSCHSHVLLIGYHALDFALFFLQR